ncbi:MAG: hypothetical protein KY454_12365 [Actinobacteria bacterium]|nr:hypothetical protein [Actinomycetota bacterium]
MQPGSDTRVPAGVKMAVRTIRGARALVVAFVVFAAGGACSLQRSGYQFVRSKETGTYFKVPDGWTVYGHGDVTRFLEQQGAASEETRGRTPFISTFSAEKKAKVLPFDPTGDRPAGIVRVKTLSPAERDETSFASLREEIVDFDTGLQTGQIEVLDSQEIEQEDGVRGQRVVFKIRDPASGGVFTIDQTTLLDRSTSKLYLLAVGCESRCYDQNRKQIDVVVDSLTIKET